MQRKNIYYILISGIPILLFMACLFLFSVNAPWLDDFEVGPMTLKNWLATEDLTKRFDLIWAPNNEHRVVILKLLVLFNFYVLGQFNIQWMIWESHLYLIPLFYFVFQVLPKENRWINMASLIFIYLSFQYTLSSYWMIAAVQHNSVIGFGLISTYLLAKTKYFFAAVFCTLLAALSNSDGLFFIPIGAVLLFLQYRWKELFIWLIVLIGLIFLFFLKYPSMNYHAYAFQFFLENPSKSFFGFFVFLGGFMDFFKERNIPIRLYVTAGFGLAIVVIWLKYVYQFCLGSVSDKLESWRKGKLLSENDLFILSGILFCFTNALMISVLRAVFGDYVYLIGNYRIYAALGFLFTTLLTFQQPNAIRKTYLILIVSIGYWGFSAYTYIPWVFANQNRLTQSYLEFNSNKGGMGFTAEQVNKYKLAETLQEFEKKGIYHPPKIK
jgi:hypothetical protein